MAVDTDPVRARLRANHEEALRAIADCADTVVRSWDEHVTADPRLITDPLEGCLQETETLPELLDMLRSGVSAAGCTLPVDPVPAPPYLMITSLGPVLRGPTAGGRLVITITVFEVRDGSPRTYHRTEEPYRISIDWIPDEKRASET